MDSNAAAATPQHLRTHRVHRFSGQLSAALDDAGSAGLEGLALGCLTRAESLETVLELRRARARLEALEAATLAHADRIEASADASGPVAADTAGWLAGAGRVHGRTARRQVRLARDLSGPFLATGQALLAGELDTDQARAITWALNRLPEWLNPSVVTAGETHLLGEAQRLDAEQLRTLGRHLLHVLNPDGAEAAEARRLRSEEDMAAARTRLCLFDDRDGLTQLSGTLPTRHASMLRTALGAIANPAHPEPIARTREVTDPDTGETTTLPRQTSAVLGEALCRLLERLDPTALPAHGGMSATVVVTVPLATLTGGLAAATLDDGTAVSPGEARRLACDAALVPAVLGTASEVLDLGRSARLFNRSQRLAMALRQHHTCAAQGCERPAAWTEAHHLDPWATGGPTDLDRGVLLCSRHHTLAHHPDYTTTEAPHHRVAIERRPRGTPRRE